MTTKEAIRILYEMLSKTAYSGGELGGIAVNMAVDALRKHEEPTSDDLEEAAKNHAYSCHTDKATGERIAACIYDFKAGAQWQKEKITKDAIDATVKVDAGGYPYIDATIEMYDYDNDFPLAKEGDKVKIIVVK